MSSEPTGTGTAGAETGMPASNTRVAIRKRIVILTPSADRRSRVRRRLSNISCYFDQRGPVSSIRHTGPFTNIAPSNFTKPGAATLEIQ